MDVDLGVIPTVVTWAQSSPSENDDWRSWTDATLPQKLGRFSPDIAKKLIKMRPATAETLSRITPEDLARLGFARGHIAQLRKFLA
jgi:hypothetical protein